MDDTLDLVFSASGPEVIFENFGDEMVIANLEFGFFYSLDGSGADIWNALVAGHTGRQFVVASKADSDGASGGRALHRASCRTKVSWCDGPSRQARPHCRRCVRAAVDTEIRRSAGSSAGRPHPRSLARRLALRPSCGRVAPRDMIEAKRGGALWKQRLRIRRCGGHRPFAASRMVEVGPLTIAISLCRPRPRRPVRRRLLSGAPASRASWSLFVLAAAERAASPARFQRQRAGNAPRRERRPLSSWMGRHSPTLYIVDRPSRRAVCWVSEKAAVKAWERSRLPPCAAGDVRRFALARRSRRCARSRRPGDPACAAPAAPARRRSVLRVSAPAGGLSETIMCLSTPANRRPRSRRCSRPRGFATTWLRAFQPRGSVHRHFERLRGTAP